MLAVYFVFGFQSGTDLNRGLRKQCTVPKTPRIREANKMLRGNNHLFCIEASIERKD